MDGNQRWAKKNNIELKKGYSAGLKKLSEILEHCTNKKVKDLTVYALSAENFKRNNISIIFDLIKNNYINFLTKINLDKKIRVNIIGNKNNLPKDLLKIFQYLQDNTMNNHLINLNIVFNYGIKDELFNVVDGMIRDKKEITSENIESYKYLNNIKDPEILIRTGGHKRLSNFLLLNIAYTELFFIDTLWPDFTIKEFDEILDSFLEIKRNYGL